ncbi:MAG: hypothetical protein ACREQB_09420, partial [Candidatus Binataceae bacterium]
AVKKLRVGNLMVLLHIGSMPHELTMKNVELFCRDVFPHFRHVWEEEWDNKWWPERLKTNGKTARADKGAAAHA